MVPGSAGRSDFGRGQAEDKNVVFAHAIQNFHISPIERADGQRTVERELHIAGARCLGAGRGYLFGQVGCGDDALGQADAVVGDKHDLELVTHAGILIHRIGHIVDQLNDQLGHVVRRGRFAGEHDHTRHHIGLRITQDALVARDHVQEVEQLALVFVDALDLHIKHGMHR